MGYETKLLIGVSTTLAGDEPVRGDMIVEKGEVYRPSMQDENGRTLKTGKKETWFQIYATVDLCKCGYESNISGIDHENEDTHHHWYWFEDGNDHIVEDRYGKKLKPVPISDVIEALRKDVQDGDYRRFKWALALLESMNDGTEDLSILMYGH